MIKTFKLKDMRAIFITYQNYTISRFFNENLTIEKSTLGIELTTLEEKNDFIEVLNFLKKELEKVEF